MEVISSNWRNQKVVVLVSSVSVAESAKWWAAVYCKMADSRVVLSSQELCSGFYNQ